MNLPPLQQPGSVGMPVGMPPGLGMPPGMTQNPGTPQQLQQMQQQMPQQVAQAQEKLDNISKVKSLIGPLRESLSVTLKTAAQTFHQNSIIDLGSLKGVDATVPRFDKNMEEFYSICDQIELHLKTSIECFTQGTSSQRYLPLNVALQRTEPLPNQDTSTLTYPQYLTTVRAQVSYAKELHDTLVAAAQNVASGE